MSTTVVIEPRGPFSLREATLFGFGPRDEKRFDGVMRLAFCVDGYREHAGVEVRQEDAGQVHVTIDGGADPAVVRDQVARILSLDHDAGHGGGHGFAAVGDRDPAIGLLQRTAPGLRPVLFHSPYEAAAWSIISARRARAQAAVVRARLSHEYGRTFTLGGVAQAAFPTPEQLLGVTMVPGLPEQRVGWLHGVARAALDGQLDAATLRTRDPDDAMADLRRLDGIGPFYATLVQVRATGVTDVLPTNEPRVLAAAGHLYGSSEPLSQQDFVEVAERWRPWRTWACVLIRAVTGRLSEQASTRAK